ncbi:alkaline phosphatase D family protein [Fulvivirga ligni]|uniref:alkaline phosphatase D family protein n=1 Tax=Fulvivirga ligni TaxID=2904246 RepID=UPI001F3EB1DA|nr:alkaline phosphatase D family protein [Fulvivirga ligni]UII21034.1 alkaline phosphatase family protein [Fulvivirga ligni]
MKKNILYLAATILLISCGKKTEEKHEETVAKAPEITISKIAFGSCTHQHDRLQMWDEIREQNPGLIILTGDNIYCDTHSMDTLKKEYDFQKNRPDYQAMVKSAPTIGIYDDHDFGVNDGGKMYPQKKESKALLLDFLDVPKDNEVYNHEGAYQSYTYNDGKLKVILLDTRYFRDTLEIDTQTAARYLANAEGDILGEEQWTWLEKELKESKADINLIISSIQIIPEEHLYEKWANFPSARKRFFDLISATQPKGAILISGDRHMAEISKIELENLPYPLYEITSSGLTHTWSKENPEANKYRVENKIVKKNYGVLEFKYQDNKVQTTIEIKGNADSTFLRHSFLL